MASDHPRARVKFTQLLGRLLEWCRMVGFQVALGEGYVGLTDAADGDHDGPHKEGGAHYLGTGQDLVLYRPSPGTDELRPVTNGDDSAWTAIGHKWESMDPDCWWGGRRGDANHVGLRFRGRA